MPDDLIVIMEDVVHAVIFDKTEWDALTTGQEDTVVADCVQTSRNTVRWSLDATLGVMKFYGDNPFTATGITMTYYDTLTALKAVMNAGNWYFNDDPVA